MSYPELSLGLRWTVAHSTCSGCGDNYFRRGPSDLLTLGDKSDHPGYHGDPAELLTCYFSLGLVSDAAHVQEIVKDDLHEPTE